MNKNSFLKITLSSLLGLVICGIALTAGVWAVRSVGQSLTAVDLWFSLKSSIYSDEVMSHTARQVTIFAWLSTILAAYLLQVVTTVLNFNWRKVAGWGISAALWLVMLCATLVLILGFKAIVSGVIWLAFGCLIALGGELWVIFSEASFNKLDHTREAPRLAQRWSKIWEEAMRTQQHFAILAIKTRPAVTFEEIQHFQTELRGSDLVYPVQGGMFILLWQITKANTPLVANKLTNLIQSYAAHEVQIGIACYPADGDDLSALLTYATQALDNAVKVGGSVIIPFSSPAAKDSRGVLAPWEGLLSEAGVTQTPVTLLYFRTQRPLSLSENYLVQKELRGRDLVTVFENGFYVLLWNTADEGALIVLAKLAHILDTAGIPNQHAKALFPVDGKHLANLLTLLDQQMARQQ